MTFSEDITRLLNPFVLHLKKMELELNCPACLKLLNRPMLLPCDHILCSCCSDTFRNDGYSCPVCIMPYECKDLRLATHVERFLNNYKNMSSTVKTLQQGSSFDISDSKVPLTKSPISFNNHVGKKHTHMTVDETFVERGQLSDGIVSSTYNLKDSDSDSWHEEAKLKAKRKSADMSGEEPNGDIKHAKLNDSRESTTDHLKDFLMGGHSKNGSNLETCAFCHSFRTTEATGEILHYLNGKQLSRDQASQKNVIHVHRKCIEWAPQIYFSGETIINLELELSRSSKLKCSSCGLKGAALGCYVKRCMKSFHVPCAYEILEIRWDTENFLMLCPIHASRTLPCDRSTSRELKDSSIKPSVSSKTNLHSAGIFLSRLAEDLLICGSDLSKEEKVLLEKFSMLSGFPITYEWKQNVTHVIAATKEQGACSRTMKYLMAILCGRWVLNMGWIKACLDAKDFFPEENYEISRDVYDCFDGPKRGRISAVQKRPKLFNHLAFHFTGFIEPRYKSNLEGLAVAAGGKIVNNFELCNLNISPSVAGEIEKAYIVCCVEPPRDVNPTDVNRIVEERFAVAEALAAKAGAAVVTHKLFLNAIAGHDLHNLSEC